MSQPLIDLQHISKRFDDTLVLDDLSLSVKENSFVTLLGPSGCGKTTTLRIIGGFESPNTGKVIFGGEDITKLPPNKRQLNTVFQKYALFPHMSIADNIAFGLKIKNKSKAYIDDKIKYALKLVNLNGFEHRSIDSLSGGQQQRIAIARAIVNEPKVLLLDEPLGYQGLTNVLYKLQCFWVVSVYTDGICLDGNVVSVDALNFSFFYHSYDTFDCQVFIFDDCTRKFSGNQSSVIVVCTVCEHLARCL